MQAQAQIQTYEGYFKDGKFYSNGMELSMPEQRKALVVMYNEPIYVDSDAEIQEWLEGLHSLLEESDDEQFSMEDFPRMNFGREPFFLADEE